MYTLWIRKPYDINEPTIITDEIEEGALALIVTSQISNGHSGFQVSAENKNFHMNLLRAAAPRFHYYRALEISPQVMPTDSNGTIEHPLYNMDDPRLNNHLLRAKGCHIDNNSQEKNRDVGSMILPDVEYYPAEKILRHYSPANGIREALVLESGQALSSGLGPEVHWREGILYGQVTGLRVGLSEKDVNRLEKAGAYIDAVLSKIDRSPTPTFRGRSTDGVEDSSHDLPEDKRYPRDKPLILLCSVSLIGAAGNLFATEKKTC
jgi:hypothetical protein